MRQRGEKLILQMTQTFCLGASCPFRFQKQLPFCRELGDLALRAATCGNVVSDLGGSDDGSRCIAQRGDRQRDVQPFAVLADASRLISIYELSPAQLGQNLNFLVLELLRNDPGDGLTYHLSGSE